MSNIDHVLLLPFRDERPKLMEPRGGQVSRGKSLFGMGSDTR